VSTHRQDSESVAAGRALLLVGVEIPSVWRADERVQHSPARAREFIEHVAALSMAGDEPGRVHPAQVPGDRALLAVEQCTEVGAGDRSRGEHHACDLQAERVRECLDLVERCSKFLPPRERATQTVEASIGQFGRWVRPSADPLTLAHGPAAALLTGLTAALCKHAEGSGFLLKPEYAHIRVVPSPLASRPTACADDPSKRRGLRRLCGYAHKRVQTSVSFGSACAPDRPCGRCGAWLPAE